MNMMKKKIYISTVLSLLILSSCSVEAPFESTVEKGFGLIKKIALNLEVSAKDELLKTRASNDELLKDFVVVFQTVGSTPITVGSYKYSDMPEVISLQAGNYKITASYGENKDAAFENPHFLGVSNEFTVKANEIKSDLGTIKCNLENVKVSINFHPTLATYMDEDAYVEVYVNKNAPLRFTKKHAESEMAGYFKHDDVCTLTATFHGVVDGVELNEVKTLNNIQKGNHYRLTFMRHEYEDEERGDLEGMVDVNASVTVTDLNRNILIVEDEILDDSERPREEDPSTGEDPKDPTDPDEPEEPGDGPQMTLDESCMGAGGKEIVFGEPCDVDENSIVILNIHSNTGIKEFVVDIVSENLHLSDLGADSDSLDLVNPGKLTSTLQVLGILKDGKTTLENERDVDFDISGLMGMLCALPGEHKFIITVGDDEGTSVVELILNVPDND